MDIEINIFFALKTKDSRDLYSENFKFVHRYLIRFQFRFLSMTEINEALIFKRMFRWHPVCKFIDMSLSNNHDWKWSKMILFKYLKGWRSIYYRTFKIVLGSLLVLYLIIEVFDTNVIYKSLTVTKEFQS